MSCRFITRKQGGTITICFAICVWIHRSTETNQRQTWKEMTWSQITMLVCYLLSVPWAGEKLAMFVLDEVTQSYHSVVAEIWVVWLGDWHYWTKLWYWNLYTLEWCKVKIAYTQNVRPGGRVAFGEKKLNCSGIGFEDMPFVHSVILMHKRPTPRAYRWVPGVELCTEEAHMSEIHICWCCVRQDSRSYVSGRPGSHDLSSVTPPGWGWELRFFSYKEQKLTQVNISKKEVIGRSWGSHRI